MEKLSGEIVDVFEVIIHQNFHDPGPDSYSAGYYLSEHEANVAAKRDGSVLKGKALQVKEGGKYNYFLLESIFVNTDRNIVKITEMALSKLTKEEKSALGIVEFEE